MEATNRSNPLISNWASLTERTRVHLWTECKHYANISTVLKIIGLVLAIPLIIIPATAVGSITSAVILTSAAFGLITYLTGIAFKAKASSRQEEFKESLKKPFIPSTVDHRLFIDNERYKRKDVQEVLEILKSCKHDFSEPLDLSAQGALIDDAFLEALLHNSVDLSELRGIRFKTPHLTDEKVSRLVAKCPKLEVVDLSYCTGISNLTVTYLACHCKNLHGISLRGCSRITEGVIKILHENTTDLRRLDITGCNQVKWWGAKEDTDLAKPTLPKLQVVQMNHCPHLAKKVVFTWAASLPYLAHFSMGHPVDYNKDNITEDEVTQFVTLCAPLERLHVAGHKLGIEKCNEINFQPALSALTTRIEGSDSVRQSVLESAHRCLEKFKDKNKSGYWKPSELRTFFEKCPGLKNINLALASAADINEVLKAIHEKANQLINITLSGRFTAQNFVEFFKAAPFLEELSLKTVSKLGDNELASVKSTLLTRLTLEVSQSSFTKKGLLEALVNLPNLTQFRLVPFRYSFDEEIKEQTTSLDPNICARLDVLEIPTIPLSPQEVIDILKLRKTPMKLDFAITNPDEFNSQLVRLIASDPAAAEAMKMAASFPLVITLNTLGAVTSILCAAKGLEHVHLHLDPLVKPESLVRAKKQAAEQSEKDFQTQKEKYLKQKAQAEEKGTKLPEAPKKIEYTAKMYLTPEDYHPLDYPKIAMMLQPCKQIRTLEISQEVGVEIPVPKQFFVLLATYCSHLTTLKLSDTVGLQVGEKFEDVVKLFQNLSHFRSATSFGQDFKKNVPGINIE